MKRGAGSQPDLEDPSGGPLYLKLGEVARIIGVPPSTIRHWQEVFRAFLHPVRTASGRHVYSRQDLGVLRTIHVLLHRQGLSSQEARQRLAEGFRAPQDFRESPHPSPSAPASLGEEPIPAPLSSRIAELEAVVLRLRQENQGLRDRLEFLVRTVSEWALRLEEEAGEETVNAPPPE